MLQFLNKRTLNPKVLNSCCRHAWYLIQTKGISTMGMAASQARFLGLTARMNNVEFEGQQINQQRTALSNKSASYYTDLLGMEVPTAPSVEEFTQTVYTFNDGALTNQITSLIADSTPGQEGKYKVSYIRSWTDDFSVVSASPSIITEKKAGTITGGNVTADGEYLIGGNTLYKLYNKDTDPTADDLKDDARDDEYWKSLSQDQRKNLLLEEKAFLDLLQDTHGNTDDDYLVRYVQNTSTGEYEAVFYNQKDVIGAIYNDTTNNSQSYIAAYKVGSADRVEEIKGVEGCYLEQDSTGRYINITIDGKQYALSTNTITDQDAYDDAMNQYEYDKALYDQSIEEINAKIEIIQAEDKNLELRLKQLDTEHNAISNEKDAVEKVIEKSVESGFKTFG